MSKHQYIKEFLANVRTSWTMWLAAFWVVLGVVETQIHLLQPLVGEKYYGVVSIVVSASLALSRMRTLRPDKKP